MLRVAMLLTLYEITLERSVTRIFALNFSTAGPNMTLVLSLALITGWTLPVGASLSSHTLSSLSIGFIGLGSLLSLFQPPLAAFAGTVLVMSGATPVLASDTIQLGRQAGAAFGIGLLLIILIRSWNSAVSVYATTIGRTILLFVTSISGLLITQLTHNSLSASSKCDRPFLTSIAGVYFAVLWFGAPVVPARWSGIPYTHVLFATVSGLCIGIWVITRKTVDTRRRQCTVGGLLIMGIVATLSGGSLSVIGSVLTGGALPILVSHGKHAHSPIGGRLGTLTGLVQLAGVTLLAGFIFAVNFAFVPAGALFEGTSPAFVLGLGGVIVIISIWPSTTTPDVDPNTHEGSDPREGTGMEEVAIPTRREMLITIPLAAGGMYGGLIQSSEPSISSDYSPTQISVMTYNLHQYFNTTGAYNLEAVADLLSERAVDIVGLQETSGARVTSGNTHGVRWLAHKLHYRYRSEPVVRHGGYGVAVLSKWPLRDTSVINLPQTDGPPRVAMRVVVTHPTGDIPVVITHLETSGAVRTLQARQVRSMLSEDETAVILGDFNAIPSERPVEVMTESFTDAWATVERENNGATFSATNPARRIDYVFHRGFETIEANRFGHPQISDHLGVSAVLRHDSADDRVQSETSEHN